MAEHTNKENTVEPIENDPVPKFIDLLRAVMPMTGAVNKDSCHWEWCQNTQSSLYSETSDNECGWRCSACKQYPDHNNYIADDYEHKPDMKHCPNCGRKVI